MALFAGAFALPLFGLALAVFAPLPLLHCGLLRPVWALPAAIVLALGLALLVPLPPMFLPLALPAAYAVFVAVPMGISAPLLRRDLAPVPALAAGYVASLAALAAVLAAVPRLTGKDLGAHFVLWSQDSFRTLAAARVELGLSEEAVREGALAWKRIGEVAAYYPGVLAATAALGLAVTLAWGGRLRSAAEYPRLAEFRFAGFRNPDALVFLFLASGFALLVKRPEVRWVAVNVLLPVLFLYFLQGLAILTFFLRRFGMKRFMALATYTLALLAPINVVVCGLGLFDLFLDFRKPRPATDANE